MRISFQNVGGVGVMNDRPDWQLPPDAWTKAHNIRFRDNSAWKTYGMEPVFDPPEVEPHFLMALQEINDRWWIYAGLEHVYGVFGGTHYKLTRQDTSVDDPYTGGIMDRWNGCFCQGVPILNNGVDVPQMWLPVSGTNPLQNLPNWPSDTRAKVVRSFKEYLIGLDITKPTGNFPAMVKWSHPAEPGMVPPTWDETDPTNDAGEYSLSGSTDYLIDSLPLGDVNLLYKQDSVWGMSFIGGVNIFRFFPVFGDFGLLAQKCVVDIGKKHFVVTMNDVIVHDGQNKESILDSKLRRYLFNDIDASNFKNSFILNRVANKEVWFCYPTAGEVYPNKAMVWNQSDNAPSFRDLPSVREGCQGPTPNDADSGIWDEDEQEWNLDLEPWDPVFVPAVDRTVLLPSPTQNQILQVDRTYQEMGENLTAVLERTGMRFNAGDQSVMLNNPNVVKQITGIYPQIQGAVSQPVEVSVGYSLSPDAPYVWLPPTEFVPGLHKKVDSTVAGNMLAIRFRSAGDDFWRLTSFDVDVRVVGNF